RPRFQHAVDPSQTPCLVLCNAKDLTPGTASRIIHTMSIAGPLRSSKRAPIPIDARAADHLRYIRETMERAGEFTAVPGWGGIAMGFSALAAAAIAARQATPRAWLATWLIEALVAVAIAAPAAAHKAHRANLPLLSGPGRKFLLSFAPPILVGALLTLVLFRAGN